MKITWTGHSCFRLEQDGYVIVTDPYEDGKVPGLAPVRETADLVLCSHEHSDHNARGLVALRKDGPACPFKITKIETWHDEVQGAMRGPNTIHLLEAGGTRVAHLGDLGCGLTAQQEKLLKDVDVLLIPVGGHYTIDAREASDLVDLLSPKHVVPMHFRDDALGVGFPVIGTVEEFTALRKGVRFAETSELDTNHLPEEQVIVLRPENASGWNA